MIETLTSVMFALSYVPIYVWAVGALAGAYLYNLYANQNALLYHPVVPGLVSRRTSDNPSPLSNPGQVGLRYETVWVETEDGVKLHAWFIKANVADTTKVPTIVFFHANAGNMGLRMLNIVALVEQEANVFVFDYRGYGDSDDAVINEAGIRLDADAVMKHIRSRSDVDHSRVVLFGRSLGGAVALHAATKHKADVAGIILENTFTSISDMVDHVFPILSKIKWLILNIQWRSIDLIGHVTQPILFISGGQDRLVPPYMVRALYDAAEKAVYRSLHVVALGDHNDTFQRGGAEYLSKVRNFMYRVVPAHHSDQHLD